MSGLNFGTMHLSTAPQIQLHIKLCMADPPTILTPIPKTARLQSMEEKLMASNVALELLTDNLIKAIDRMKKMADMHRTKRNFKEGDWVFLRLQPYRQISVAGRSPHKLSPVFYGPYKVLQKIGQVAHKLDLPIESRIHLVFHVSQLKKKLGTSVQVQHQMPTTAVE